MLTAATFAVSLVGVSFFFFDSIACRFLFFLVLSRANDKNLQKKKTQAISGIFGMNLVNGNEDSHAVFVATSVGSSLGAVAVFCLIFAVCKKRGLI